MRPLKFGPVFAIMILASCSQPSSEDWSAPAAQDWPMIAGDWASTRYSTLDEVNTSNVADLGGAWVQDFGGNAPRGTPVVYGGRMFVAAGQKIYALDPESGEILWESEPRVATHGLYKGVAVGDGLVFVGLGDSHLIALRQDTGEELWTTLIGDADPDIRDRVQPDDGQMISAAPAYVNGVVIAGLAIGDYGLQGRVVGLDAKTGDMLWRFNTVPNPGDPGAETWPADRAETNPGGGGIWMSASADPDLGLAYIGVGNPIPQWGGEIRKGDNLYTSSVVALDIETGALRWHYQLTHHDLWEAELGTPLILYDTEVNGAPRKALAVVTTYGYLFTFDRATGEPLWPVEERPVAQNPRLYTSPTQPFPVNAEPIGPSCVPDGSVPDGFLRLCHFDPIDYDMPNAMYPMMTMRAAPLAYSPKTRQLYGTGAVWPSWMVRAEDPWFFIAVPTVPGMKYEGILAALDPDKNAKVWERRVPFRTHHNGSGFTATAGGLLFNGNTDGIFEALDAETGEQLWQFQVGSSVNQPPAVYEVSGAQHFAVSARDGLWAFKLGGAVGERAAPPTPPSGVAGFRGRVISTSDIEVGAMQRDSGWMDGVHERFNEYDFAPMRARVEVGRPVTWKNNGKESHTIRALDGSWTTGPMTPGESVSLTFNEPGAHTYICDDHKWSYGELIVGE